MRRNRQRKGEQHRGFVDRHIGTSDEEQAEMLELLGYPTRAALIDAVVPASIRQRAPKGLVRKKVSVDLCRLNTAVPHPLLKGSHRRASRRHTRPVSVS